MGRNKTQRVAQERRNTPTNRHPLPLDRPNERSNMMHLRTLAMVAIVVAVAMLASPAHGDRLLQASAYASSKCSSTGGSCYSKSKAKNYGGYQKSKAKVSTYGDAYGKAKAETDDTKAKAKAESSGDGEASSKAKAKYDHGYESSKSKAYTYGDAYAKAKAYSDGWGSAYAKAKGRYYKGHGKAKTSGWA